MTEAVAHRIQRSKNFGHFLWRRIPSHTPNIPIRDSHTGFDPIALGWNITFIALFSF
jgi:hypothetical protein